MAKNQEPKALQEAPVEAAVGAAPSAVGPDAFAVAEAVDPMTVPVELPKLGSRVLVSVDQGTMVHLFTNQVVSQNPSLMTVDAFAIAQIEARKWVVTAL